MQAADQPAEPTVSVAHEALFDNWPRLRDWSPVGDAELVDGIRDHLNDAELRAAGATAIIEGDVDAG